MSENDDLKAKMLEALNKKKSNDSEAHAEGHHKEKGPAERSRMGGSREFRRKAGG
ncbi:MAG: DUF5302 domain-containing protein [Propionibacteriaceae bacterium]|nr:DUF5302 domain-containing protein [Propionibacteriaceae bacterium]